MADFIAKAVSGGVITEFTTTPVELAQTLAPGQYDLRPIGGPVQRVTVLDVQNTAIPTVTGSATPGGTLTANNGTWTGVLDATTPYERRWLDLTSGETVISGAVAAAFSIPTSGYEGKLLAHEVRAQNARGQWTGWARSAVITVANLSFNVSDAEWTWDEDVDDAETRQGYATLTLLADLPAGKRPRFYRGPNAAGNGAQSGWMTGSGRNWTFDAANAVDPGARDYAAIYMQSDDGTGPITQISTIKYFVASNVPGKPALPAVTQGTVSTGDVIIDPADTAPAANGRAITGYGYSVDAGTIIPLTGGAAVTPRTVTIASSVSVSVRLHVKNANGWSVGSDPVSIIPPTITAGTNTSAPALAASLYGGGQFICDFGGWSGSVTLAGALEQSDTGTSGWTTYLSSVTPDGGKSPLSSMTGKFIRLKVTPSTGSPAYSPVIGPLKTGFDMVVKGASPAQMLYSDFTMPAISLDGGIWFSALLYFDGSGWSGYPMALGTSQHYNGFYPDLAFAQMRSTSGTIFAKTASYPTPAQAGWYRQTWAFGRSGTVATSKIMRNDLDPLTASATGNLALSGAALRFVLFGRPGLNEPLIMAASCDYAWGTGDPTDMHAFLVKQDAGAMRAIRDYNFATDTKSCALLGHWWAATTAPASWNDGALIANTVAGG